MQILVVAHDPIPRHVVLNRGQRVIPSLGQKADLTPHAQQVLVNRSPVIHQVPKLGVLILQRSEVLHLVFGHVYRRGCLFDCFQVPLSLSKGFFGLSNIVGRGAHIAHCLEVIFGRLNIGLSVE